jgi:ClpP class serine protease
MFGVFLMSLWLLESITKNRIEKYEAAGFQPSLEQQANFEAKVNSSSASSSKILSLSGNEAKISVHGTMTKQPNFFAMLFGGGNTTYSEIINALGVASSNPKVEKITLDIDSPGGQFDGLFDAIAAMQATKKPINAVISGLGASAAYALASQADNIMATNKASRIGSVGVVATYEVDENEVTITSTEAPKKRPDVTTEEGVAAVREEIDALHDLFVESIAEGRNTTKDKVNANFGRGATFLAEKALKNGMIDGILESNSQKTSKSVNATIGNKTLELKTMDLEQLKTQHPDVYKAAAAEGAAEAKQKESDRIEAHLIMGEAYGSMEIALEAIKSGEEMTSLLTAKYLAANANNKQIEARQEDNLEASAADNVSKKAKDAKDEQKEEAQSVAALLGLEELA